MYCFSIEGYIQEIQKLACKILKKYVAHQIPEINHYLLLLDTNILLHSHSHNVSVLS